MDDRQEQSKWKITPQRIIEILTENCRGRTNGLTAGEVVELATNVRTTKSLERVLRQVITGLRDRGYPICAHPTDGYFWADTPEDIDATRAFLRSRALTSMRQAAKLRRLAQPVLAGQQLLEVGAEPEPPEVEIRNYAQAPPIACEIEIPEILYQRIQAFLDEHPHWSQGRMVTIALAQYLALDGEPVALELYSQLIEEGEAP